MRTNAQNVLPKEGQATRDCFSLFVFPHFLLLLAWNTHVMAEFSAAMLDHKQAKGESHALWMTEQMDRITGVGLSYKFLTPYLQTSFRKKIIIIR